jgi:hypothetical protein
MRSRKVPTGVSEMEYRRALESIKKERTAMQTVDAAALQLDMAKKYNLSLNSSNNSRKASRLSVATGTRRVTSSAGSETCPCCGTINELTSTICTDCGYFLNSIVEQPLTLAQKRGLVKPSEKVESLSQSEWDVIEQKLDARSDASCPICMSGFSQGHEVLLSCSHIFHRSCLQAFENFMKNELTCPICRFVSHVKCASSRFNKLLVWLLQFITERKTIKRKSPIKDLMHINLRV